MVGVTRIGEIVEPANPRRVTDRGRQTASQAKVTTDSVNLSSEAQRASQIAQFMQESQEQMELRQEEIQQIRDELDKGTYKVQQVVIQVAARLSGYIDMQQDKASSAPEVTA